MHIYFQNEDTFGEIKDLLLMKDYEGLGQRLLKRMEFGTAGKSTADYKVYKKA